MSRSILACALLAACRPQAPAARPAGEQVVARVDDQVITVADVEERLARLDPFSRMRYASPEQKKRFLENLVRFEVMAKEARRKGYERDPDVQRVVKKHLIDLLLQREIDDKLDPDAITEAEVAKYYQGHIDDFRRPEQVRASQIFVAKDKDKAEGAAGAARAAKNDKAFRDLVEKYSEDEDSKARGGDLTFFDRASVAFPKAVVEATFALRDVGDVSPVVASDKGFHVLRLTQRRPGFTRPLAEVAGDVRRMILAEARAKKIEALVAEMRTKIKVEVYEAELAKVTIQGPAAAAKPAGANP